MFKCGIVLIKTERLRMEFNQTWLKMLLPTCNQTETVKSEGFFQWNWHKLKKLRHQHTGRNSGICVRNISKFIFLILFSGIFFSLLTDDHVRWCFASFLSWRPTFDSGLFYSLCRGFNLLEKWLTFEGVSSRHFIWLKEGTSCSRSHVGWFNDAGNSMQNFDKFRKNAPQ